MMELSLKDLSTIQRMLGKIEGVAFTVEDRFAAPLFDAVEVLDEIIFKEDKPCD